jgi:hypothetical protein
LLKLEVCTCSARLEMANLAVEVKLKAMLGALSPKKFLTLPSKTSLSRKLLLVTIIVLLWLSRKSDDQKDHKHLLEEKRLKRIFLDFESKQDILLQ